MSNLSLNVIYRHFTILYLGPFVSAVLNRFGFRVATFTGSLLAGSGYVLSGICTEFPYFVLTGGVMAGNWKGKSGANNLLI